MTPEQIIEAIQKHSLTVRCLPFEVITLMTYREGNEKAKFVDSNGNDVSSEYSIFYSDSWKRNFLKRTRKVEKGGWWYVKSTKNTDSTVRFNRKTDKFFAPTLAEAMQLFLDSIQK